MSPRIWIIPLGLAIAGCTDGMNTASTGPTLAAMPGETTGSATDAPPPPKNAVTVEQFDTTSAAERAEAAAPPTSGNIRLGTTVASLGDPSDPGFWAETGLVDRITPGRLEYPAAGTSVQVELRPSGGSPGAGTRVSLPALRVLNAPLTELPTLVVFEN